MKKYISMIIAGLGIMLMTSCSKDTEGLTGITYYPVITLDGAIYEVIEAGVPYQEHGYSATLQGEEYTSKVEVSSNLDYSNPRPGYYQIRYYAVNSDGFSSSVYRYVIVAMAGDDISGFYTTSTQSYRDYGGITYYGGYPEVVYGDEEGLYHVSDLLGGWYEYRAGYGSNYAMQGLLDISEDGSIELVDSYVPGWEDGAESLDDGVYDAEEGTISYVLTYTETPYIFHVVLKKDSENE